MYENTKYQSHDCARLYCIYMFASAPANLRSVRIHSMKTAYAIEQFMNDDIEYWKQCIESGRLAITGF